MGLKEHWEHVYQTKGPTDVSWFQTFPTLSLRLVEAARLDKSQNIIDVSGGASVLVDHLLDLVPADGRPGHFGCRSGACPRPIGEARRAGRMV